MGADIRLITSGTLGKVLQRSGGEMTRKMLLDLLGAVLIIVAIAAYWLFNSLDALVQAGIEKFGPEVTQVSVKVGSVRLDPVSGEGEISGLRFGNPNGFKVESALKAGTIRLRMNPASVASEVVLIHEVIIQSPDVTHESGAAGNNLETIQKNIESYVVRFSGGKKDGSAPKKKLIIENLYIRDAHVNVNTVMSAGKIVSFPVSDLHPRDIGKREGGASPGEVMKQVCGALMRSTGNVVSRIGSAVSEGAKSAVEGVKKLFK